MKIIVCVKQVPDTADIKWTENNTMIRDGVESIINPFDSYALETAIRLKESNPGTTITVLTMGPPNANAILKKGIAMGADEAILLTDKKFAGADTVATSRTLANAILTKIKDFDLIICGQFAIDGDTAQTGPSIAEYLAIPQITYAKEASFTDHNSVIAVREIEDGLQRVEMQMPGLLCMLKCDYEPRMPLIRGFMKASRADIATLGMEDIGLDSTQVGIKGSPTFVSKAFRPPSREQGEMINGANAQESAKILLEKLKDSNILV